MTVMLSRTNPQQVSTRENLDGVMMGMHTMWCLCGWTLSRLWLPALDTDCIHFSIVLQIFVCKMEQACQFRSMCGLCILLVPMSFLYISVVRCLQTLKSFQGSFL
ncbi:hypothetical protein NFI96_011763, partial [Prochilodus magdalenae]